jgi:multimeric flavodoxin WrbA/8-oxo-dGTP pyrophosphatase MutT (NUDIX family)
MKMIVVVNFSNRKHGNCYSIAGTVKKHYGDKKVKIFNFIDETYKSCGNCEYECFTSKCSINDGLKELFKSILQSEETIFIIPNYYDYPSSNFFLFNERCHGFMHNNEELHKRYLEVPKKFMVVSSTNVINFKTACAYHIPHGTIPAILFFNARKFHQCSLDGNLMQNSDAVELVNNFLSTDYTHEESAMAIVLCQNTVLATIEEVYDKATLSLPKGHIEEGEKPIDAAIRECFEETNEIITPENFVEELKPFDIVFVNYCNKLIKKTIYPLVFKIDKPGDIKSKEERIKKVAYLPIGEFLKKCSYENVKTMIIEAISK